ncbi:pentapeptide repeat-containing protein [Arthrobacter humicola]
MGSTPEGTPAPAVCGVRSGATLSGAVLSGAVLPGAELPGAELSASRCGAPWLSAALLFVSMPLSLIFSTALVRVLTDSSGSLPPCSKDTECPSGAADSPESPGSPLPALPESPLPEPAALASPLRRSALFKVRLSTSSSKNACDEEVKPVTAGFSSPRYPPIRSAHADGSVNTSMVHKGM